MHILDSLFEVLHTYGDVHMSVGISTQDSIDDGTAKKMGVDYCFWSWRKRHSWDITAILFNSVFCNVTAVVVLTGVKGTLHSLVHTCRSYQHLVCFHCAVRLMACPCQSRSICLPLTFSLHSRDYQPQDQYTCEVRVWNDNKATICVQQTSPSALCSLVKVIIQQKIVDESLIDAIMYHITAPRDCAH